MVGTVKFAQAGIGPAVISPADFTPAGEKVTVKLACQGSGVATVVDSHGGAVLKVLGCKSLGIIYSEAFTGTDADKSLHLDVDSAVRWELGVWVRA